MASLYLTTFQLHLRAVIYRTYVERMRPPTAWEAAEESRCQLSAAEAAYAELAEKHILVLRDDGRSIRIATPFSTDLTPFRVTAGGRTWFASSAWDAFGVGALLKQRVEITAMCPDVAQPLVFQCDSVGIEPTHGVVHFMVPPAKWTDDIALTCATTLLFPSEPQVRAWCQSRKHQVGGIVPVESAWRLAQRWYRRWLDEDWRKRSPREMQTIFTELGFDSPFWRVV